MDTSNTDHDALLAIAQAVCDDQGFDEWNLRFQNPVLHHIYHLAAVQLGDETCRAHALPTWAAIAEAEQRSAQEGHPSPAQAGVSSPEPWTKTTGETL